MVRILSLRLDNETYQKLKEFCKQKNITASDLIRSTINSILSGSQTIQIVVNPMQQTKNNLDLSEIYIFKFKKMLVRFASILKAMDLETSFQFFNPLKPSEANIGIIANEFIKTLLSGKISPEEELELKNFLQNVLIDLLKEIGKIIVSESSVFNNVSKSQNYNDIIKFLLKIEMGELSKEIFEKSQGLIDKYSTILKDKLKEKISEMEIKNFLSKISRNYIQQHTKIMLGNRVMSYRSYFKKELTNLIKEAFGIHKKLPNEYHETIQNLLKISIILLEKIKKMEMDWFSGSVEISI